jgi:hypothetical protein
MAIDLLKFLGEHSLSEINQMQNRQVIDKKDAVELLDKTYGRYYGASTIKIGNYLTSFYDYDYLNALDEAN